MRFQIFKKTMRRYMIFCTSLLIVATISLLTVLSLSIFSRTITDQAVNNIEVVSALSTENIDSYLQSVENSILTFISDQRLIDDIKAYDPEDIRSSALARRNITSLTRDIIRSNLYVQDIIVIAGDLQTNFIDSSYNAVVKYDGPLVTELVEDCRYDKTLSLQYRTAQHNELYYSLDNSPDLLIYFPLFSFENAQLQNIATVIFRYDIDAVTNLQTKSKPRSDYSLYIMDENYHGVIAPNEYQAVFRELGDNTRKTQLNGRDCILTGSTIATNGWKIGYIVDLTPVTDNIRLVRNSALTLLLFSILAAVLLSVYIGYRCTSPIFELTNKMQRVEEGDFETQMETKQAFDEVRILTLGFNTMIEKINYLIKQVYQKELAQNRAELKALQSRINPHFLYNSLQTINSMAIIYDCPPIQSFVTKLAALFEYVLYQHNKPVPLSSEIEYTRNYLSIHEVRFGTQITFRVQTEDEALLQTPIFKLMLQPLVENSIKHGFGDCEREPVVLLSVRRSDAGLDIDVTDNGAGISPARLEEINLRLSENDDDSHFGLVSINKRLRLSYGDAYGLRITSREGFWTKISLQIPLEKEDPS